MISRTSLFGLLALLPPIGAHASPGAAPYVWLGVGASFLQDGGVNNASFPAYAPVVGASFGRSGDGSTQNRISTGAAIGYQLGNGLRFELQGDWRESRLDNAAGLNAGGSVQQFDGFANALYDFDIDFGFPGLTPYLGVGVGYGQVKLQGAHGSGVGGQQIYLRSDGTDGGVAVQGIVGLEYAVQAIPGFSITADYRYTTIPGTLSYKAQGFAPGLAGPARFSTTENYNHTILVGVRYAFGLSSPTPASEAPQPTSVSPAPAASRTYLVFFDWDRANLSPHAREIVSTAAQASRRVAVTRIAVNGYTDTSGTAAYNKALSLRRAQAVASELVVDGVPARVINIAGFGEDRPLVPTGPGVREPQNRRVEIILN